MISVSFVNGETESLLLSDPLIALENAMMKSSEEIDTMISSYLSIREDYLFESMIMGKISEEKSLYLESGKDNIFKKIGDTIIDIYKKFEEFVKGVIEKLKNIGFKSKSDTEKLEKLLKEHPELKDEVICAYKKGDLNVADARSLKELNSSFDEIVKLSKQKDIKPDTLRGKVEAFKKKFENIDNSKVVKTAKATTAVVGAAAAVIMFKKHVLDARKSTYEYQKMCREKNEDVIKAIEELKKFGKEHYGDDSKFVSNSLSKAQILKNAELILNEKYSKLISKEQGKVDKLSRGITAFIAKHMKKASDDLISDVDIGAKTLKSKEAKERDKERQKNRQDSSDRAYGSEKGKLDYRNKNKRKVDAATVQDALKKREGTVQYDRDDYYNDVRRRADIQADVQDSYIRSRDEDNEAKNKKKKPQTINVKIVKDDNDDNDDN